MAPARKPSIITANQVQDISDRLRRNVPVRRTLPDGGRIHIDRQLPFLILYRPPHDAIDAGTARFAKGEASYLIAPRRRKHRAQVTALLEAVAATMSEVFGGFLIIEIWAGPHRVASNGPTPEAPGFRIVTPRRDVSLPSVTRLVRRLQRVRTLGTAAQVELVPGGRLSPPGMPRISRTFGTARSDVRLIGVEVRPIYQDSSTGEEYPVVGRAIHRQLSKALQQAAYEFALHQTRHRPRHYQALGRRAYVRAASRVDADLAKVSDAFDLLLAVSPVNTDQAYRAFRRSHHSRPPSFRYRHLDVDPTALQRVLYAIPVERVEDPTLEAIFREKQRELSLQLDLLSDRGSPRFLHTSVALYGDVDKDMAETAADLLDRIQRQETPVRRRLVDANSFAARAAAEIDKYRQVYPGIAAKVEVRDDLTSLMVSRGSVLVGSRMRIPENRVEPLIQHEVGTHVVTYWNGTAQRFRLLAAGLAGYDELQEGLAVLAEYLVSGLTGARLRTLAARVVAARAVRDGSEFLDTYRLLVVDHGFAPQGAFQIATRVHRGGGFVKDAIYLRGLRRVVDYLAEGGRLDTLLVGKVSVDHAPVIEELQRRRVLVPPPLRPSYLDEPDAHYRLERLREHTDLAALAEPTGL